MHIDIHAQGVTLTDGLRNQIERRLRFALAHSSHRIGRVNVRLADTNGPRGGVDKYCRVEVTLNGLPPVVIEDIQPDLQTAVDRATGRAGRTVSRRLELPLTRRRFVSRRGGAAGES
jgi:ribosome-associated translation inhibitor RaiA